jgi:ABC-type branched-subunit amino acid transport system ATPase component
MLKILNLKKHFGGVKAVDDCSFEIEPGKITALIGPNGSGKSTVFNLVAGILKPDSGQILFDGKNIVGKSVDTISNLGISRVFQQAHLFRNLTVKENLFLALDNEDMSFWKNVLGLNKYNKAKKKRVGEALRDFEITKVENNSTGEISFGQKRLTELARAVLNPHKLLILDEPVAGVNPRLKKEIEKIILNLKTKGETILFIEHDMGFTLSIADSIIVLDAGKVIAQGTPEQIKKNPKVLEAYLGE